MVAQSESRKPFGSVSVKESCSVAGGSQLELYEFAGNEVSLVAGLPPAPGSLSVITPAPLPTVHVPWTWSGALNFDRFVIQQRDGTQVWQDLATLTNPATDELGEFEWTGQMLMSGQAWPFRIVVHLTTGESAMSAEGYFTQV